MCVREIGGDKLLRQLVQQYTCIYIVHVSHPSHST